ncbi:MAG: hypothetical protein LBC75_08220 [Fibromonadaceae bacterium]|jgi:hypothetical protein|nr:hypothetical protein [Fibromonadaceae bacterium]
MKKALNPLVIIAMLVTVALAANVENPLYAPAQLGFYSKTGFSFMYKQSDANLAMKAKDWEYHSEYILRGYEDFGLGLTDRFALRGAFGYTHDFSIERSGPSNARLGLGYRAINQPEKIVVWDLYMDAWLGGISKMKAQLIPSKVPIIGKDTVPFSFKYDNYANGRWGIWFGTSVGKTWDKFTLSAFGEVQKTFGNDNNEIKIDEKVKPLIKQKVYGSVYGSVKQAAIAGVCKGVAEATQGTPMEVSEEYCKTNPSLIPVGQVGSVVVTAEDRAVELAEQNAGGIASAYVDSLPEDFSVKTKGVWDYVAGLKTFYEINNDWSVGGGFTWRHRGTNSIEKVNITNTSKIPNAPTVAAITEGIGDSFKGSMEDGVEEYTLTLLGSRQFTKNLQLTLFGECTFDTAEDKAQLGSDIRAEVGLRMNWQF